MALTVEELQIVLSCDATTAQAVLEKMDATVKAYTQKFQKYFNTMGGKGGGSKAGSGLDNVGKNATNAAKRVKDLSDSLRDMQRNEYKVGKVLSTSDISSKINENIQKGWANKDMYKNAAKEVEQIYQQMSKKKPSKDYLKQVRAGNINAENNPQWGHQGEGRMLAPSFAETFKATLASLPDLVNNFVMKSTDALSKVGGVLGKTFAIGAKVAIGAVRMIGTVAETTARAIGMAFKGAVSLIRGMVGAARRVGSSIKKAFNHTLLGKFVNRLKAVSLRMAAMGLIRGTIEGAKKGLEELAKTSASSAKAMNTVKAAGGSIKMALGAAVMPIVKALAPVFVQLAGAISAAGNAIARFFAVVTGQSQYTAVNFSSDLDGISESAGGAGKAVKGMLADFDELNVLQKNSGGGGGGSSGVEQSLSTVADLDAVSSLGDKVREAIESGNWTGVGEALNSKLNGISEKIKKWGTDLKNSDLGENIAEFFNGLFGDEGTFYNLGDSVGTVLDGIITQVGEFIENFNWEDAGEAIKAFFQGISDALDRNEFVLKLKIKINEIKEQFQQFKVDLLVWANGLPGWVKDFLGWFGADIPAALDKAATELANTRIEGANLQTKLNELNNTDVDVEVDAEVGDAVNPVDLVKGPGWRPASGTHGKKVGEGTAEIIPVLKEGDAFIKDMNNKVTGKTSSPWKALVDPKYNNGKDFVKEMSGKVTGTTSFPWQALVDPRYNSGVAFTNDMEKKITGATSTPWKALVDPKYNSGAKFTSIMKERITGDTSTPWQALVDPKYNNETSFVNAMKKNVTGQTSTSWKALVDPKYNSDTSFFAKLREKVTGVTNYTSVNPTFSVTQTYTKAVSDATADKTLTVKASLSIDKTKTQNAISAAMKGASSKVSLTIGGETVNGEIKTYARGGIAYGTTSAIIGEYVGAKSNPEVVAPLSKLQGILERSNVGSSKDTMTREQANTMIGLLRELTKKETVVRPSVELGQVVDRSLKAYART